MEKTRSLISFTLGFGLLALLPFSGWAQAPAITSQPGPQTVLEGQTAGFSITATGSGLAYQWRRGTTNLVNGGNILGATSATLTITNAAPSNAVVNLNCFITNSFGSVTSRSAGIWILNDNDRDLMADFWETAYALNTNNAADALLDSDGDGVTNRFEFNVGSSPLSTNNTVRLVAIQSRAGTNFLSVVFALPPGLAQLQPANYVLNDPSNQPIYISRVSNGPKSQQVLLDLAANLLAGQRYQLTIGNPAGNPSFTALTAPASGLSVACPPDVVSNCAPAGGLTITLSTDVCQGSGDDILWAVKVDAGSFVNQITLSEPIAGTTLPYCNTAYEQPTLFTAAGSPHTNVWRFFDATAGTFTFCTQLVSVVAATIPSITCPSPITTNICGAAVVVTYANPVIIDGALQSCAPASGSSFGLGTTPVICTATNSCSTNTCTFNVVVSQIGAVTIGPCPSNITNNICGTNVVVTYANPTVSNGALRGCVPASGSSFGLGTTLVTCTATNACSTNTCTFNVVVNQIGAVTIGPCPNNITNNICGTNVVVTYANPTVSNGALRGCVPASGSSFGIGTTLVTCTATNACSTNTCTFNVVVTQTPAIVITCPPSITNACGASGVVTYANPTVTGGTLKSCVPASGSTFAPGTTAVLCTATNACSTNTCTFTVTVRPVPVAVITPPNLTVCAGQNATFTASGGGSYSWSGPGGFTATTAAITRTSVTLAMAGTYTVIVTSAEGCTNSATATLTVVGLLPDGTCPQSSVNKDFTNSTGHTVDGIEWLVQGVYTSVNWHYDGPYPGQPNSTFSSFAIVPSGPNTLFRWSGTASIPSGGVAHVGFCVLGTSITTLSVAWTLGGVPTNCVHQVSIGQGHSHASGYVVFQNTVTNCESVVLYAGNLRLEWYSNSVPLAQLNGFSVRSNLMRADVISASPISLAPGASGFTAIPTPPPGARFAVIQVTVGDGPTLATPGNSIDFFELDAPTNMPPLIIQQPRSQTNTLGSNVTFTVTASGGPPLGYQWRFNGVNIPGATGSIYTIINAQTNNSGNYDVLITNVSGSLISPAATLTLQAAGTGPADLWIRDDVSDVGNEPNLQTTYFWISDDIWVRRLRDPNYDPHPFLTASPTWTPLPHEDSCYRDPKSSSPNYIYVRIRNRGGQPSSGTETLHVYWAKASTGLSWGTGVAGNSDWIDHMETPACSVTPRLYGYEVTKPRKSGATATAQEKSDYVAAIQAINTTTYMFNDPAIVDGNSTGNGGGFIDPVTYFNKQNEIHYNLFNAGIHNSLRFLPWHREEMSRYEILLREFNPTLTLLYWDWTTDPSVTGPIVGPSGYMGAYNPPSVGAPFPNGSVPNFGGIYRSKFSGTPSAFSTGLSPAYQTAPLLTSSTYPTFWGNIEGPSHNSAHVYNGGIMASGNAASDPLFFMLHANCDRLWAKWQRKDGANVNLWDPSHAYDPQMADVAITSSMQPWNGTFLVMPPFSSMLTGPIYPWTPGGGYIINKAPTSHSLVYPPIYDDVLLKVPVIPADGCCIIEIPFYPPSPSECGGFSDPGHVCLLARIEPVNVAETPDLYGNVKNNRKIAWKNTHVQDCNVGPWVGLVAGRIGGVGELIRNARPTPAVVTLQFDAAQTGFRTAFNFGNVRVRLENNLYQAWLAGGQQGTNVVAVGTNNEVRILASGARMAGLALGARAIGHMDLALELTPNYQPPFGDVFHIDVLQFDNQGGTNAVGGQRYDLDFNVLSLVQKGSAWKFLDGGQAPTNNWQTINYNDTTWKTGTAPFGYGRGEDIVTDLAGAASQPATAYFRQTFTVPDPTFYHSLNLNLLQDDGVVVYLNGQEISRLNMPTGAMSYATIALAPITGAAARAYRTINVSNALSLLVTGNNVLAAEVHRGTNGNPADITFDLQLAANVPAIPYQPPTVVITTPKNGDSYRVGSNVPILADVLDPDGDLSLVRIYTNNVVLIVETNPPYSAVFPAPALGSQRVSVEAQDIYGNITRVESLFSVVSNLQPTVSMTAPTNLMFPSGSAIQLAASASDSDGSIAQVVFYVKEHMKFGSPQIQVGVATNAPYAAQATNLPPGHYMAYATTTDNQGGLGYAMPVAFMIHQPAGTADLRISRQDFGAGVAVVILEWDYQGAILESSIKVTGPWTAVSAATSPYGVDTTQNTTSFFRLRLPAGTTPGSSCGCSADGSGCTCGASCTCGH